MEARRGTSVDADEAFEKAVKELDRYAKCHHPVHEFVSISFTALCMSKLLRAVLGNMQNIMHVAAEEDKNILKTQSRLRFSVGDGQTDIRRKSGLSDPFEARGRLAWAVPASQDSISNPKISH